MGSAYACVYVINQHVHNIHIDQHICQNKDKYLNVTILNHHETS